MISVGLLLGLRYARITIFSRIVTWIVLLLVGESAITMNYLELPGTSLSH